MQDPNHTVESQTGETVEVSAFSSSVYIEPQDPKSQYCLKRSMLEEYPEIVAQLPKKLHNRFAALDDDTEKEEKVDTMAEVGRFFAEAGVVPSNRTGRLMKLREWGRPTGSYVATIHKDEAKVCPECGAEKSETETVLSTSHNARKATKYKCDEDKGGCGRTYKGITTG